MKKGMRFFGRNAVRALVERRARDIERLFVTKERSGEFKDAMKVLAKLKRPYRIVDEEELQKISQTTHHEGICAIAPNRPAFGFAEVERRYADNTRSALLPLLEDVANPHNVGAILRSAAHFGVREILVTTKLAQSGSLARIAEGGAEYIDQVEVSDLRACLRSLKRLGFSVVATSPHSRKSIFSTLLPERTVFLIGSEGSGINEKTQKLADLELAIPGSGAVESLNVGVASAICFAEHFRQHSK